MTFRQALTGGVLLFAMASQALATPPRTVDVEDIPLGANDTHVFLLRRLGDNMGLYGVVQTDVLLIARNRATGADDEVWPVARSLDNGPNFAEDGLSARVEFPPLADAVNPFDILQARKARLVAGAATNISAEYRGLEVVEAADGLGLAEDGSDKRYHLDYADISSALTASLNRSRDAVPAYSTGDFDPLRDVSVDPAADCDFGGFFPVFDVRDGAVETEFFVRVTCENDDIMAPITTYLEVPVQP